MNSIYSSLKISYSSDLETGEYIENVKNRRKVELAIRFALDFGLRGSQSRA